MKKIVAKGIGTRVVVPHKYRIHLTFSADTDISPLLAKLVPKRKEDIVALASKIDMDHPDLFDVLNLDSEYYFDIFVSKKQKTFTLIIGHMKKSKLVEISEKYISF